MHRERRDRNHAHFLVEERRKHRVIYTIIRRETGLEYRKVNTS